MCLIGILIGPPYNGETALFSLIISVFLIWILFRVVKEWKRAGSQKASTGLNRLRPGALTMSQ